MAVVTPRIMYDNAAAYAATVISASSSDAAHPVSRLRDQAPWKPWRSASGWTIIAGFNNKLDFNRGGVKAATITAGNYATGALMAAAVVAALEAADATPVWACSYSSGTFTISADLSFVLLFSSGANVATSAWADLGYSMPQSDSASTTYQPADTVSYQSRHWIKWDMGSAMAATVAIVNSQAVAGVNTYTLQSNATDAWTAPSVTQAITDGGVDELIYIAYFASNSYRWRRLLINDVTNPDGYSQIPHVFIGEYVQPSVAYTADLHDSPEDLSQLNVATHGAHVVDQRQQRDVWSVTFAEVLAANLTALEALRVACPRGVCFYFDFDSADPDLFYGWADGWDIQQLPAAYHTVAFTLLQALS